VEKKDLSQNKFIYNKFLVDTSREYKTIINRVKGFQNSKCYINIVFLIIKLIKSQT